MPTQRQLSVSNCIIPFDSFCITDSAAHEKSYNWTREWVLNGFERCSCFGCCYRIFSSLKRFHFATDCNKFQLQSTVNIADFRTMSDF